MAALTFIQRHHCQGNTVVLVRHMPSLPAERAAGSDVGTSDRHVRQRASTRRGYLSDRLFAAKPRAMGSIDMVSIVVSSYLYRGKKKKNRKRKRKRKRCAVLQ
jgi:hypothetical protein